MYKKRYRECFNIKAVNADLIMFTAFEYALKLLFSDYSIISVANETVQLCYDF